MEKKMINCPVRDEINTRCSCPKTSCLRHGLCCECVLYHKNSVDAPFEKRFPNCLRELFNEALHADRREKS